MLLEALPHLVVVTDPHGGAQQLNARWLEYTGLSFEQAQNRGWLEAIHPYDRQKPDLAWDWERREPQSLEKQPLELEYRLRRFDGVYRWFLGRHAPLLDLGGQLMGWVCTATDVDSHKRVRDSFEHLFQTTPNGVLYQDATGQITDANPAAERILGLTLEQLIGRVATDPRWYALGEDGSRLAEHEHPPLRALHTGKAILGTVIGVYNPVLKATCWLCVDALPQFQPGEDTPYQVYTHFEDITERKQAKTQLETLGLERERLFEQLALEQVRLEAVLAQMPPGVVVADADNRRVSLVNPQLERIYGVSLTPGMALERLERPTFHPGGKRRKGPSPLGRALEGESVSGEELEIERPDGSRAVVLASAAPIYDRQGKLVAAVLTCEDLSQRRLDEAEIRRLSQEIQRGREALTLHGGVAVTPQRFLELMGELYAQFGQPQLEGRLIALLLLKVEPVSLGEVARALEVSKVAVGKVSQVMLRRGDLQIIKSFSSREHLLALTDHNYIRDLSVRRVASWAISILCESLLETNHLDPGITEQIRAHLELHTRVAVALEGVLSPLERHQASVLAEHLRENWDAVPPRDPVTAREERDRLE